uniref:Uncharacterized protein n=1 Tax=Arundo donax TaxID=35708 RepID=A0A0A8ZDJ7_ARUDO
MNTIAHSLHKSMLVARGNYLRLRQLLK